jgi:hypothetical protein
MYVMTEGCYYIIQVSKLNCEIELKGITSIKMNEIIKYESLKDGLFPCIKETTSALCF